MPLAAALTWDATVAAALATIPQARRARPVLEAQAGAQIATHLAKARTTCLAQMTHSPVCPVLDEAIVSSAKVTRAERSASRGSARTRHTRRCLEQIAR